MTGRELAGWTPGEKHTHYAADGETVIGYTVVERESRIDDADRADLLALAQYEAEVCQCGFHPLIANDEANTFGPTDRICPVCAGISTWGRIHQEADEAASAALKGSPATDPRPWDGRHSFMQLLRPDEATKGGDRGDKA